MQKYAKESPVSAPTSEKTVQKIKLQTGCIMVCAQDDVDVVFTNEALR